VAEPFFWTEQYLQPQHLLDNLPRREVSRKPIQPTRAKHAPHATPNLRTDTNRSANLVSQQHALDLPTVRKREQQFFGAILCLSVFRDLRRPQREAPLEVCPQALRQISHLVELTRPPLEQPTPHLPQTIAALPSLFQPWRELLIDCV
jgi:hypothetical protein